VLNLVFSWHLEGSMTKIAGSGSISQKHGSEDPDLPQNVMDPEHWFLGLPDPEPLVKVRIRFRILTSSGKNSNKNLHFYCFVTVLWLLSLKNDVNVPSKSNKQKD
jgi:hypothetical protein